MFERKGADTLNEKGVIATIHEEAAREAAAAGSIRQWEQKYKQLFDTMTQGVLVQDLHGKIIEANPAACEMLGVSIDVLLGHTFCDPLWRPIREDGSALLPSELPYYTVLQTGQPVQDFLCGISRQGEVGEGYRWLLMGASAQFAQGVSKPFAALTVFADVTGRKRAEDERKLTTKLLTRLGREALKSQILERIAADLKSYTGCEAVGLRILDKHGKIPYEGWDGFPSSFYETESPLSVKTDRCMCINVICGDVDPRLSFITDGGSFYMNGTTRFLSTVSEEEKGATRNTCNAYGYESVALIPIRLLGRIFGLIHLADSKENQVPLYLVESIERTANHLGAALSRLITEEAFRESEERFRSMFMSSADYMMLLDVEHRIQLINRVAPNIDESKIVGTPIYRVVSEADHARVRDILDQVIKEQRTLKYDTTYERPDGTVLYFSSIAAPVIVDDRVIGSVVTARDESEIRKLAVEKETLTAQLHQSQKMEALGKLAGGVAHDFNNLLGVILGHAELMSDESLDIRSLRDSAGEIASVAVRASELTGRLLAFSRKQVICPRPVDLNRIVEGVTPILTRVLGEEIALVTRFTSDSTGIVADPGQMEQVLVNLAVNARDAMPEGGSLFVQVGRTNLDEDAASLYRGMHAGPHIILSVSDTGAGMEETIRERIFEPFFTTKPEGKGTGLGLSVVYGIVQQHNGSIEVRSAPGKGTTFTVYFPETGDRTTKVEQSKEPVNISGTEHILLVEDDEVLRSITAQMLTRLGYRVHCASNGQDAAKSAEDAMPSFDLLLTDVIMPAMNGPELAEILTCRFPSLRVLYTSGYATDFIAKRGAPAQGGHFLPKPYTAHALGAKVRAVLDRC